MSTDSSKSKTPGMNQSFIEAADCFLEELTEFAAKEARYQEFYGLLVNRLQHLMSAQSATIWMSGQDEKFVPVISANGRRPIRESIDPAGFDDLNSKRPSRLNEFGGSTSIQGLISGNRDSPKVLICQWSDALDAGMGKVFRDLVDAVTGIADEFERRMLLEFQESKFQKLESFVRLLQNASSTLDLEQYGYQITNDCRSFLEADRVWLFSNDMTASLIACSSVSDVNKRSETVRKAAALAKQAFIKNESYSVAAVEIDGENEMVQAYVKDVGVNGFYVTLLSDGSNKNQATGVLITEYLEEHDRIASLQGLNNLTPFINSTFNNARGYTRLPFRRSMESLNRVAALFSLNALPKTFLFLGCVGMLVLSTFLLTDDFEIQVTGELRPTTERHLFAPADSFVADLHVRYGEKIESGTLVASLVSEETEFKLNELQSDLSSSNKKWQAAKLLRSRASQENKDSVYLAQLTAEIEQTRLEIETLRRKIEWYRAKQDELSIHAPISGQVVTRDIALKLLKRPVKRGDLLLMVAETDSGWQIVFEVPDREFGYLLEAKRNEDVADWRIRYRLNSDLQTTREAIIESTDQHNWVDKEGKSWVRVTTPIEPDLLAQKRVGQTVNGKIHCGRKSLFFIWTRDIRDFLRSNFYWM